MTTPLDDDEEGGHMTQAAGAKKGRKKPEYAGGLVLEPKKGKKYCQILNILL